MTNIRRIKYKKGDVVKVYSLQSFFGPGFYKGTTGYVRQDQYGGSVLICFPYLKPTPGGSKRARESYEVYPQQLRFVKEATPCTIKKVDTYINKINKELEEKYAR